MVLCAGVNEVVVVDEKPIWQRIETDTDKSFAAFCVYRDLGADRSIQKTQEKLSKSSGYLRVLYEWSSNGNWVERAAAYDEYLLDEHRREIETRRKIVQTNEWNDYTVLRKGVAKRIKVMEDTDWANTNAENIHSLLTLMRTVDDYARRAVGLPEKITESKTDVTSGGEKLPTWGEWVKQVLESDDGSSTES
jgi:hypothetical protein